MTSGQSQHSIAIIGGGRMGEAMASGWLSSGLVEPSEITIAEPSEERRAQLSALGVGTVASGPQALPSDIVVLAVKPQVIEDVVPPLREGAAGSLVVSVAAGVTTAKLESMLAPGTAVVRVMPNTPAMVGEGMAVVSGGSHASEADVSRVVGMFDRLGNAVSVAEKYQNAATAISGSGPAYFALVVDALAQAGARAGLEADVALKLAVQTMRGTAKLLDEGGMQPQALIEAVSSPGGTTVAALAQLEASGLRQAFDDAVVAAVARADELGAGK